MRANLSGHDSHGVLRIPQYARELASGRLNPAAEPVVEETRAATALVDAQHGFGQHSTAVALDWCVRTAPRHGLAAAAVRHSMHIGRLGEYTERAAEKGLVSLVTVGIAGHGYGSVAPFGGAARFLGTNPWSIGIPAQGRPPFIFDAASSAIAEGKVRVALAAGKELPPGVLLDREGRASRSPADLYEGGTLLPVGGEVAGHKGYGLALASALLGGLAMVGDEAPSQGGTAAPGGEPFLAGVFVCAIDPAAFGDAGQYGRLVAALLAGAGEVPAAAGSAGVLVAGEPELRMRAQRLADGIPIPETTWAEVAEVAARFSVELPRAVS